MQAQRIETDVLVIGGGAAGCAAALKSRERGARTLMVVKGKMGRSGATPLASGLGVPTRFPGPYPVLRALRKVHSLAAGVLPLPLPSRYAAGLKGVLGFHHWLVDQDYFVDMALWLDKEFYPALEASGIYLLRDDEGRPALPPGRHQYYVIHTHGMTGYQFGEAKRKEVLARDITVMEEAMVFSLLRGDGAEVAGALVLDYLHGRLFAITAKATILATGHTNWLSRRATGTREMAANGLAMAVRAGAELSNMEIQWYHAADMAYPESWMRLHNYPNPLTGTTHQSQMVNSEGEPYMRTEDYDTIMPYTIQMKLLHQQAQGGKARWDGGNFTDYRLVEPENLKKYQYHWEFYEKLGLDMTKDRLESVMTWHMSAGGVRADTRTMETGIPRLYIAGAVGGHMLGGVPNVSYDGTLAGANAAGSARRLGRPRVDEGQVQAGEGRVSALLGREAYERNEPGIAPIAIKKQIREIVWDGMMFVKSRRSLEEALARLAAVREESVPRMRLRTASARYNTDLVDALDVADMLEVSEMAAHASLARQESRGPHFREDFPFTDNDNWLKQVVVGRRDGKVTTRFEPVRQKYIGPEPGRVDYLGDPFA